MITSANHKSFPSAKFTSPRNMVKKTKKAGRGGAGDRGYATSSQPAKKPVVEEILDAKLSDQTVADSADGLEDLGTSEGQVEVHVNSGSNSPRSESKLAKEERALMRNVDLYLKEIPDFLARSLSSFMLVSAPTRLLQYPPIKLDISLEEEIVELLRSIRYSMFFGW